MKRLDTSTLGPIKIEAVGSPISRLARDIYADAVAARGSAWRNAADSIRSGGYGNVWIEAALSAIERGLRTEPSDE